MCELGDVLKTVGAELKEAGSNWQIVKPDGSAWDV